LKHVVVLRRISLATSLQHQNPVAIGLVRIQQNPAKAADFLDQQFCAAQLDAQVELRSEPVELSELSRAVIAEFELLGTNSLGDRITASPAISGNELFYRTDSHVFCIEENAGR
jgi:hypothetical protein